MRVSTELALSLATAALAATITTIWLYRDGERVPPTWTTVIPGALKGYEGGELRWPEAVFWRMVIYEGMGRRALRGSGWSDDLLAFTDLDGTLWTARPDEPQTAFSDDGRECFCRIQALRLAP